MLGLLVTSLFAVIKSPLRPLSARESESPRGLGTRLCGANPGSSSLTKPI
jgi:hypothetical protein